MSDYTPSDWFVQWFATRTAKGKPFRIGFVAMLANWRQGVAPPLGLVLLRGSRWNAQHFIMA